ncbi:MAG: FKBP-type peptidyl-prolyl cis-trans isomerase [Sphingomonas sp.]|uniref:FKBP-type peptidyl-prolyl cis-trans isomerase n=1 Tax=Sphingomonas sp. TaxID=28214 RepID=UPI003F81C3A3
MSVTAVPLQPVKRSYIWLLWIGIAVAVIAAFLLARQGDFYRTTASGLKYHEISAGTGEHPSDSDMALVMYEGTLPDGTVFDRSQQPTPMPVAAADPARGKEGVVSGFSEALKLMRKGAHYKFLIPANLAYGEKGQGPIKPNTPLTFDVQLLGFIPQAQYQQMMMQQMMNSQGGLGGQGAPGAAPDGAGAPSTGQENLNPGK